MRKLAILVLLVMVGCNRQVSVTTAPSSQQTATANPNVAGGATHREALVKFFAAIKAQDVQAVSRTWGTAKGSVADDRTYMTLAQMEQRIIFMIRCLRHDSYTIRSEAPGETSTRIFNVELKLGNVTAVADFSTILGPGNRYLFSTVDLGKVQGICGAQ